MRFFQAGVASSIVWAVRRGEPVTMQLNHPAGWLLINPLAGVPDFFAAPYQTQIACVLQGDTCYLLKHSLDFVVPDDAASQDIDEVPDTFLRRLRSVTKQVQLPTQIMGTREIDLDHLPDVYFPEGEQLTLLGRVHRLRDSFYDTPVTQDAALQAGQLPLDFVAPVYDTLLMDAMAALIRSDYKSAILFGAIAVESLAGTVIDEEHRRLRESNPPSDLIRPIDTVQAGGNVLRIDPIYRRLATSNTFSVLLSELPLYVFRRSMLAEDQDLYRLALQLYRTRNNLAHTGDLEPNADLFPLSRVGAIAALECAVRVFEWFRVPSEYFIPRMCWRDV